MNTQDDRFPVTLLTGFLGAGKTTLLNNLLRDPSAGSIAVIMNELGEVGLDHDMIEEVTDDIVLMHSGCLCCSVRGDLAKTMVRLLSQRKRGELSFDRIVIETTGIADPGPILTTMATDNFIAPYFRMDGVVTLADAANGPRTLDTQFEAVSQIATADLIIVTKTDLVTPAELDRFEERLVGINSVAQRVRGEHGHVPSGALFGLSAMRPSATSDDVTNWLGSTEPQPAPFVGLSGVVQKELQFASMPLPTAGGISHHDNRIESASIEIHDPVSTSVFDLWLDTLLGIKGFNILRVKGIVHYEGMETPCVFHAVRHIVDAPVPLKSWSGKERISRVVVIARDMTSADLKASLETLRMRPEEAEAHLNATMIGADEMPF